MSDSSLLLQCVIMQRDQPPAGWHILTDGTLHGTADNSPPGPDDLLERDRPLNWLPLRQLEAAEIAEVKAAVAESGFFELPSRLLINYCKEDPPTAIWTADIDGRTARVVVYDPRPRRSAEIDTLLARLASIVS